MDALFGGVLVVGAGDHYQCGCIGDVQPPLLSMLVRHNFDVIQMRELFRHCGVQWWRVVGFGCDLEAYVKVL